MSGPDPGVDTAGVAAIVRARLFEDAAPPRIGRFAVLERLGAGGMGVVYAAFDAELDRRVAIKLLFAGADDRGRLAREAQVMARLNHPNVAHVYEVGRHDDCTYVAMEYVRGRTLRAWVLENDPSARERLAALEQAGRGLAAAHAAGLIHRDFKPDNVMMGDDGRVRVLDFGLARDAGDRASATLAGDDAGTREGSESTPATDRSTAAGAGTPAYAAPEQARGESIDARADVYSFCVTAWELLCGQRPDPEAPDARGSIGRTIERVLRRGLARDPRERPQTIHAVLAELARDPSVVRRRWMLAATCVAVVGGALTWQRAVELGRERACAAEGAAIAEIWNEERAREIGTAFEDTGVVYARDAFSRARARIDGFARAWSQTRGEACMAAHARAEASADPRACLDDRLTHARALLDRFAEPNAEIVQLAVGAVTAIPDPVACADPRATWLRTPGTPASAEHRRRLIEIDVLLHTAALEPALEAAEALARELAETGGTELAQAQLAVGQALRELGRYEPSRIALETAFYAAGAASDDFTALEAATALVDMVGSRLAQPERAHEWARTARMYVERLGLVDHPAVASLENNLGTMLIENPQGDRSLVALRRALEIRERVYGELHPAVASSRFNVGVSLVRRGQLDEGIAYLRRAVEIDEATLGPDHPDVANVLNVLGSALMDRGEYDDSMTVLQRALAIVERALGPEHESVGSILISIANLDMRLGHLREAIARYERAVAITELTFGNDHPRYAAALSALALAHERAGDTTNALEKYERAVEITERALGPEHGSLAPLLGNMGIITMNAEDIEAGVKLLRRTERIMLAQYGADTPERAVVLTAIGWADITRGHPADAIAPLEEALAVLVRAGVADEKRAETEYELARALLGADRDRQRALELARSVVQSWTPIGAPRAENLAEARALVRALER